MKKRISKNMLRRVIYGAEFRFFAKDFEWSFAEEVDAWEQHGIDFLTWLSHATGGVYFEKPRLNRRLTNAVGEAWARSRNWCFYDPFSSTSSTEVEEVEEVYEENDVRFIDFSTWLPK